MRRLALVVLVASCSAILALRYFSGKAGSREPASQDPERVTQAAAAGPSAGENSATGTSATAPQVDTQTTPKPARDVWRGFLSWMEPSPQRPGMSGGAEARNAPPPSIAGKVLDEAGQPVPGMDITAEPVGLFQAPKGASPLGPVAQARSGLSGAYRFEQLAEGEYRLRTVATDLYLPTEAVVRTGVDSADLVLSGERQLSIQGRVEDSRGKPLEGVRVISAQTLSAEVSTDQNGSYLLQIPVTRSNRNYVVRFELAGYRAEARQLNESQIYGQSTIRLDARLTPIKAVVVVAGRVSNREGAPLRGQAVSLLGPERYEAVTNQTGEFVIPNVEAGQSYSLQIPARSPYRPSVTQVQVGPEGLWQDVVIERGPPESGPLSGRMMDIGGNPLPRFTLWLQSSNPAAPELVRVTSDDMGRYAIAEVPLGILSFMTRSQPRFLIRGINVPEGGVENVDLVLDWAGYDVRGRVVDQRDRPVAGSRVVLFWSYQYNGALSQSERETASDADGFFRFAQVGPGLHYVRVSVPGIGNARVERNVGLDFGAVVVQLEGDGRTALGSN